MKYFWSMRSINLCTSILINDGTCKTVATAHISKSIFSISALIIVTIKHVDSMCYQYIIYVNIEHCNKLLYEMHDIYKNNNFFIHTLFLVVQSILYILLYIIRNI